MSEQNNVTNSLAHTKWNCKYHIVFAPKYRRKVFFEDKREDIREIIRTLCKWKGVDIIEGEICPDHIHLLLSIPPKISVSGFMGYLKGKSSLMIFQKYGNMKFAYRNREFWCKGYYVDTVGKNTKAIKEYIAEQLKKNHEYENSQIHISDKPDGALLVEIDNKLFDEVYEGPLCISEKIILSHEPINLPYFVNIHGHDHAGKFRDGKNLNVAANVCNYTPINLKNEIKNGLLANVLSTHRMTIDNASRNPLHKRGNKT